MPRRPAGIAARRRARFESLEPRALLSITVTTLIDEADGSITDGDISLRDAIALAPAEDTILFAPALTSNGAATLQLAANLGELVVNKSLAIQGPGAQLLTIRAVDGTPTTKNGDGSRLLRVDNGLGGLANVAISGLTLTGGDAATAGGAVLSRENLTISACVISGNASLQNGGGVASYAGLLTLSDTTVRNNTAARGGGVLHYNGTMNVSASTIASNSASLAGGGVFNFGTFGMPSSGTATITNSTISGNTSPNGGGIFTQDSVLSIHFSTITANTAPAGAGSGIRSLANSATQTRLAGSIVAGNTNSDVDLLLSAVNSFQSSGYNLVGTGGASGAFNHVGDQVGINPQLGPLVNNGGSTATHALLPTSTAIDGGNPQAAAGLGGVPQFDERGTPFGRVVAGASSSGARIDIGAFERQANPLPGDFNFDRHVDAADFTVWRDTLGSTTDLRADGNGNGIVDEADFTFWKLRFGQSLGAVGAAASVPATSLSETPELAAIALDSDPAATVPSRPISRNDRATEHQFLTAAGRLHDEAILAWLATRGGDDREAGASAPSIFRDAPNSRPTAAPNAELQAGLQTKLH